MGWNFDIPRLKKYSHPSNIFGPKIRNIRYILTFKKGNVSKTIAGNRSVRSLDCDNMCIISIWAIRNYDIRFLYKILKSRKKIC